MDATKSADHPRIAISPFAEELGIAKITVDLAGEEATSGLAAGDGRHRCRGEVPPEKPPRNLPPSDRLLPRLQRPLPLRGHLRDTATPVMRMVQCLAVLAVLAAVFAASPVCAQAQYDVVWDSPGPDASASMPLGNGDIALNAWIEPEGDLVFLIGKSDSWGDNGRLLKVGRVRVSLDPSPLLSGQPFRQQLHLRDATLEVRYGEGDTATALRVWVDALHPVIHVAVDGPRPMTATASIERWRLEPQELPRVEVSDVMLDRSRPNNLHGPTVVGPDSLIDPLPGRIGWFHHNTRSVGPALTAQIQGTSGFERPDPLLHRTFGAVIQAEGAQPLDAEHLRLEAARHPRFDIHVLTVHPSTPADWLERMDALIADTDSQPAASRRTAHERWWAEFWDRSWIHISPSKSAEPRRVVPPNHHPVKVGMDQGGGHRFVGTLGRVSLFDRALSVAEVRALAHTERSKTVADSMGDTRFSESVPEPRTIPDSSGWTPGEGLSIEAWIKTADLPAAGVRLVDKITPGSDDGFLFDTYPGRSLRLITDLGVVTAENVLPRGRWVHVAAIADGRDGSSALYVNGECVARRSTEILDDTFVVGRAYALQRFIDACAGRGRYPIKFNGSLFTVPFPGAPGDADYRRWGPGYWWQNTRLPYLSMCMSGDFDLLQPLFKMYAVDLLPLCRYRTQRTFGHAGAFLPECVYFWGEVFSETYGWTPFSERGEDKLQTSRWHKWEWVCGLELLWMMLDDYEYTLDETFLADTLLPAADEILKFFDLHYDLDENGKLLMHPAQALETWWDCTNPMPEVAGLHAVTERLLALPLPGRRDLLGEDRRNAWSALRDKLPPLPVQEVDGVRMLAPAARFAAKHNIENPELYAVFPFRRVSFATPDAALGIAALEHRLDRGNFGWRQDELFMAYLGLAEDARRSLVARARSKHAGSRFPAFWGPNYDWIPDQDHGGVLMKTLQAMLLQTDGKTIHLLPAWPVDWNVSFRLHAPYRTVVECRFENGEVQSLEVTPENRAKDVILELH